MKSGRVRSQDWQALFHLTGDLSDASTGDAEGGLHLLLERLFRIIGASGGYWCSSARTMNDKAAGDPLCGWRPAHIYNLFSGSAAKGMWLPWTAYASTHLVDPYCQAIARRHGRHWTSLRRELVDDRTWEHSVMFNELLRPIGIGDRLDAAFSVAPDVVVSVGLDRNAGERPFGMRERETLRAAIESLGWFHRHMLNELKLIDATQTLTPREQKIVPSLLSGRSEKQIALALGLTARSIHIYVQNIYQKLHVHSRAELMSLWVPGGRQE